MTKAQWAAGMKDPTSFAEQSKDMSEDYTEFNGQYGTRLDGKAMNSRLAEAAGKIVAGEMANPKVQVYNGDVAILTYNYVGLTQDKDGKQTPDRAKSTRVFVKKDNKWMLVHANFASDPLPKQ
jgi:ketosteroid isomerase-like protein